MTRDELMARIRALKDEPYGDMQKKLIPTVDPAAIIGVRTPALRALAREAARQADTAEFLSMLPHAFFEENQVHAFLISDQKDASLCFEQVERFLPWVDNWATCDQLSPRCFRKHRKELMEHIRLWLASGQTYTVRFGLGMLMQHFLEEDFDPAYLEMAAAVRSEKYYVNMMIAWYFATALAKQYEAAVPYLEQEKLERWTHNKAIQKAVESCRIPQERKDRLKLLRKNRK